MTEKLIKRNPVFQADEINLLDSLVYKHVLENKQKGAVQVAQKSKYWNIVADEFNAAALNVSVSYPIVMHYAIFCMINVSICTSVLLLISKNVGRTEKITKKLNYVLKKEIKKRLVEGQKKLYQQMKPLISF